MSRNAHNYIVDARPLMIFNTKCPFKFKHLLPSLSNKVSARVSAIFW